jgi:hypothetical protein
MQRNIDARGRAFRRNSGIACCVTGLAAVVRATWSYYRVPLLIVGSILILAGLFQLYEARKGWSAIRAMGFKTPI